MSGDVIADGMAVKKHFKMSSQARVKGSLIWDDVFGEGFIQWVSGSNTRMIMGYDPVQDTYRIDAPQITGSSASITTINTATNPGGTVFASNFRNGRDRIVKETYNLDISANGAYDATDYTRGQIRLSTLFGSVNDRDQNVIIGNNHIRYSQSEVWSGAVDTGLTHEDFPLYIHNATTAAVNTFAGIAFNIGGNYSSTGDGPRMMGGISIHRLNATEANRTANMIFSLNSGTTAGSGGSDADHGLSTRMTLTHGGDLNVVGDVVAYVSSDERLKNNITIIENPIDKVKQLKGVEFEWNGLQDTYPSGSLDSGIIAQDVQKVLPQLVKERDNGYLGVRHDRLVGLLVESIKEQQTQIDKLKKEVKELKNVSP